MVNPSSHGQKVYQNMAAFAFCFRLYQQKENGSPISMNVNA